MPCALSFYIIIRWSSTSCVFTFRPERLAAAPDWTQSVNEFSSVTCHESPSHFSLGENRNSGEIAILPSAGASIFQIEPFCRRGPRFPLKNMGAGKRVRSLASSSRVVFYLSCYVFLCAVSSAAESTLGMTNCL